MPWAGCDWHELESPPYERFELISFESLTLLLQFKPACFVQCNFQNIFLFSYKDVFPYACRPICSSSPLLVFPFACLAPTMSDFVSNDFMQMRRWIFISPQGRSLAPGLEPKRHRPPYCRPDKVGVREKKLGSGKSKGYGRGWCSGAGAEDWQGVVGKACNRLEAVGKPYVIGAEVGSRWKMGVFNCGENIGKGRDLFKAWECKEIRGGGRGSGLSVRLQ